MEQNKVKVLFISHVGHLGGAETVFLRFLAKVKSFTPFVLLPNGDLLEGLEQYGISVYRSRYLSKLNKEQNRFWVIRFCFQFIASLFEIFKEIIQLKPDIVQSNNVYTTVYCIIPCLLSRTPLIWHMHDFVSGGKELRRLIQVISLFAKKTIAVSNAVKKDLTEAGVPNDRIVTIYNSISTDDLKKESSSLHSSIQGFKTKFDILAGIAGTLEERKGILECIQALSLVNKAGNKRIGLIIIGEASDPSQKRYEANLKKEIEKHGLKEQVLFLGRIKEIRTFFQTIDVFIHYPKNPDPLPTVILEAIALNCPVVVSDNGGNPEIIQNGRWGKPVKANDPEELAATLLNHTFSPLDSEERGEFLRFFSHQQKELLHFKLYSDVVLKLSNEKYS
ncbi:glycosyltransferase family 4 protein [bacterium]|nr:glycosyltransferase family 4 protein [bacterium]